MSVGVELTPVGWLCVSCRTTPPGGTSEPREPSEDHTHLGDRRLFGPGDGSVVTPDRSAAGQVDRTAARARALGIAIAHGRLQSARFSCVLPNHDHTARLHPAGGFWLYRCVHISRSLELGEVRALRGYGAPRELSELERIRWRELLDYEAGLSDRGPADIPLPARCSPATRKVGEAWRLLVGLRDPQTWPLGEPFVFARAFVMARAGVTDMQARRAVRALEAYGSMIRVGQDPGTRSVLWRPGPMAALFYGSEEAVVDAVRDALDATELE